MKNISLAKCLIIVLALFLGKAYSQVAINNTGSDPDNSAMLDINSPEKGLLIPRVTLVSTVNGETPVTDPATGLLVYNLGGNNLDAGFYVWNGMTWSGLATLDQVQNVVHGAETAPVFGEIYEYHPIGAYSVISIPSGGTYAAWNTAAQGDISEMTTSGSALVVSVPGIYNVSFSSAVHLPSGGKIVDAALFVNGTRKDDMHARAWFKEGSKPQDLSFSGLTELNTGDSVEVYYTMDDNGSIRMEMANLNLTKLN